MEKKLKVGLVGCGGMGNVHCDAYKWMQNVEVVALCDIVIDKAEAYKKNFGFDCYTTKDYMDLVIDRYHDPQLFAFYYCDRCAECRQTRI